MSRLRYKVLDSFEAMVNGNDILMGPGDIFTASINYGKELVRDGKAIPVDEDIESFIRSGDATIYGRRRTYEGLYEKYRSDTMTEIEARRKAFIDTYCIHKDYIQLG